ncbi:MAG: rod shape-determining protein MreC, partial [Chitinophagaceae bacterium]|nr:rod shape-determining protein MreC [Chitinophagaceae bacterium]
GVANEITGWVNKKYNFFEDFFTLRNENQRVHKMNDSLMNLLHSNFVQIDTTQKIVRDKVKQDSTKEIRRYLFRAARVIYNTVNYEKN